MSQRLVIVSGGSTGIGESIVGRLIQDGFAVVVFDISAPANSLAGAEYVTVDISERQEVTSAITSAISTYGAPFALVHNAAFQFMAPFHELTTEGWDKSFAVNVTGAFNLSQEVLPHMAKAGQGRVVFITSSSLYSPVAEMSHYIATKGALTGLMRGLSVEFGVHNITVNAVAPGLTRTSNAVANVPQEHFDAVAANQAIPRNGLPEDQAGVVSFLLSDNASFMTGQTLLNDGGEGHL